MTEYLRVKQKETGHKVTVSRTVYDFAPDAYTVLKEAATDAGNNPLEPELHEPSASTGADKEAGAGRTKSKEND